jgi:diguanylate cyclase (GGDEF)-like protein
VEAKAEWGEHLRSEGIFASDECWALRRGQIHLVNPSTPALCCPHISQPFSGCYIDVPMMALGETIGVLHVEAVENDRLDERTQDWIRSVAEYLSLSISNLKLHETLHSQSTRDPLTGLFNRRYMEETLEREILRARRNRSPVGIIMLDIDCFKDFNDNHGHEAGDAVLRELGITLQHHVRGEDVACRFGGEEFVLILPNAAREVTLLRAERIREAVKFMTVEYHHQSLVIAASFGVAVYPEHGSNAKEILRKADEALYLAKHKGRNRVEVAPMDR